VTSATRRTVLGSALALAACGKQANGQPVAGPVPPLKSLAPFPIGTCLQARFLDDPTWAALAADHFSQLTAEWEMKMEYIARPDGGFQFDRADRIAGFAASHGMRLFGHALVWYANEPDAFKNLDETRQSFGRAYDNYITAVVGRYRGRASGWDVVNEPILDDGAGLRQSLWSRRLGDIDHIRQALDTARAADPGAVLFINDYNLESRPAKLAAYQRLIETLLKAGAPLGGIGCQTHTESELPAGSIARTIGALARFGLPLHVSEMDVSVVQGGPFANKDLARQRQGALYAEAATAFAALPSAQQFAFTVWGIRDGDSWLARENRADAPLLFDDAGRAKASFSALAGALRR
jgi:endo-1,4-beta-xylanase